MTQRPYVYQPLQGWEIRLIHLCPSSHYNDDLYASIIHEPLIPQEDVNHAASSRLSRKDLQKTLPEGWEVFETPENRYLFCFDPDGSDEESSSGDSDTDTERDASSPSSPDEGGFLTTWDHPDPTLDRTKYELPPDSSIWDQKPTYEALSYCWGPEENVGSIHIISATSNSPYTIPIRRNLDSALRNLRLKDNDRVLWVDAICINQDDDAEKAIQVARMADVYSRTSRVVIWLGPAENESDLAVSTLAYLGAQVETTLDTFRLTSPGAEEPTWYGIDVELPYTRKQWKSLEALVSRPWFSRVWTAQEIQLANRLAILQVGSASVSWALFRRAIDCLKDKPRHGDDRLMLGALIGSIMNGKNRPLVDILRRYARRACFKPQDKIYGMLAMMPSQFVKAFTPDYSLSVAEVYAQAFVINVELLERWDLFSCGLVDRLEHMRNAPTWVPDFSRPNRASYFAGLLQFAAGNSKLSYRFIDSNKFQVQGVRCAVVESVGCYCYDHSFLGLRAIRSWEPEDLEASYITGGSMLDAFLITILQNDLRERHPTERGWPTLARWKRYSQKHILKGATGPQTDLDTSYYLDEMALGRCAGRVFMRTKEGYIGLGPKGAQTGDIICIFPGCNVPVVLRPIDSGGYQLVGDSFVYGLNDAQGLLGPLPQPWRVQIFDHPEQDFRIEYKYFNEETKELRTLDPRLEDDTEWEEVPLQDLGRTLTGHDPLIVSFFRNRTTGKIVNSDPRMLPEAVEKRGVKLEWLVLR